MVTFPRLVPYPAVMRFLAALALLVACTPTEPIAPDDAGPCGAACGIGTICQSGQCRAEDSGTAPDVSVVDAGTDSSTDTGQVLDVPAVDAGPTDTGQDAGSPVDTGCPSGWAVCDPAMPRCIDLQRGDRRDGGVYYSCGRCGVSCGTGAVCEDGRCTR